MVIIVLSSIVTHAMLPLVSGAWWDDWKFYVNSFEEIREHYISAGRVDAYYLIYPGHQFPVWLFRLTVLACFTLSAVVIYFLLIYITQNTKLSFLISVLYNIIPVNDARILKCIYPYTIALLLFWLATYLLVICISEKNKKIKILKRIISLVFFGLSFSMNSLLFFYMIPIMLLWFCIWLKLANDKKISWNKIAKNFFLWIDFYILPFLFWIIKKIYLSPEPGGLYENYNSVSISKIVSAVNILPFAITNIIRNVIENWYLAFNNDKWIIIFWIFIFIIAFSLRKILSNNIEKIRLKHLIIMLFLGFMMIGIGLFPYVVVRQGIIGATGLSGRDSLLVCIGFSVVIYCIIEIAKLPAWVQYAVVFCLLVTSNLHFDQWYLTYLQAFYEQKALQAEWLETDDVEEGKTFIYISKNKGPLNDERYYSLNALAKEVYGDTSRFISKGIDSLERITTNRKKELYNKDITYCFNEYDLDNIEINGIMVATYKEIPRSDILKQKYYEIFNPTLFEQGLKEYVDYKFYSIDQETSDIIYKQYFEGNITSDEEILYFLEEE